MKLSTRRITALPLAALAALAPFAVPAAAQAPAPSAVAAAAAPASLEIRPAAGAIRIDASLDDAGWVGAARVTHFVELEPREGSRPPVETEVRIAYDETNLYLAFLARDPDPGAIRAALQPRDELWSDDWVAVLLDPYGDGSLGYYLLANPIGVQADMQVTSRGRDSSIDFVFETAGRVTEEGYVVEMAIPFRSLRLPARDVHEWGIMLVRNLPRSSRHVMTWPAMSRNNPCQICQVAPLRGLAGIRAGGKLELLPAAVVSRAGSLSDPRDPASFQGGDVQAQPSLGLKYTPRPGWTAEATLNPDFSQVESDAAQVGVNTTFALFFPERRPFFQEGMDLYATMLNVFYSRSINAPRGATKLTGRAGRTSIGYVGAVDEHTPFLLPFHERSVAVQAGRSLTQALRVQRNFGGSHLGALATDRRLEGGGSGSVATVDGMYRFGEVYSVTAQLALSHTREPDAPELTAHLGDRAFGSGESRHTAAFDGEQYTGHATALFVARQARHWSWDVFYLAASPTYRADTGFQTRNDFRRLTAWTGYTFFPDRHGVERFTAMLFGGSYWDFGGARVLDTFSPSLRATLPRQTYVGVIARMERESYAGTEFHGVRDLGAWVETAPSAMLRFGANASTGRRIARRLQVPQLGDGADASLWAAFQPDRRMLVESSASHERLRLRDGTEVYSGYVARTRFSYQHTRELNLRLLVQYDDFGGSLDLEPLLMYQLNPFTIFYVGSTHAAERFPTQGLETTGRQYFAKFQYLLRR